MKTFRWLLFIPASIFVSVLISGLLNIFLHWLLPDWRIFSVFIWFSAGSLTSFLWMGVGMAIAPNKKRLAKWLLLPLLLLTSLLSLIGSIYGYSIDISRHVNTSLSPNIGHIIMSSSMLFIALILIFSYPEDKNKV